MASYFLNISLLLWKQDRREQFPSWLALITFLLSSVFELSIYWFTSKALGESVENFGNYFQFVVTGQLVFFLPIHLIGVFTLGIRDAKNFGTLEPILLLPSTIETKMFWLAWGSILRNFLHLFSFLFLAVFLFGFSLNLNQWLWLTLLQIIFFPIFVFLGYSAAGAYLYFGRGVGFFHLFSQGLAILSGVYFPLKVFPWLESVSYFSPLHLLMELSRNSPQLPTLGALAVYGFWWAAFLIIAPFSLRFGLRAMQKRGKLEFAHHS